LQRSERDLSTHASRYRNNKACQFIMTLSRQSLAMDVVQRCSHAAAIDPDRKHGRAPIRGGANAMA
jgi:hypothetical protein